MASLLAGEEVSADGLSGRARTSEDILRSLHVLHPYFGFTMRPGATPAVTLTPSALAEMCHDPRDLSGQAPRRPAWAELPANALGMWSEEPFPYEARPGDLVIGLFGGSVAAWFALQGKAALRDRLAAIPELAGQRVVVLGFGIPGAKQPQQLAVLNYVLSRGQHLDLAINLDGINELLWASYNHDVQGIDFSFPTSHLLNPLRHVIHGGDASAEGVLALARSLRYRMRADRLAAMHRRVPGTAIRWMLAALERRLRAASSRAFAGATAAVVDPERDPLPLPPPQGYQGSPPVAAYWRDCSLQFHRICAAHRILYLHILQPNPYSSQRRPTEREAAFLRPDDPILRPVIEHYPRLAELGQELRGAGVFFASAEAALSNIPQAVFSDCWGHLNQLGNDLLAELVGRHLEWAVHEPVMPAQDGASA